MSAFLGNMNGTVFKSGPIRTGWLQNDDIIQPPDYRSTKPETRDGIAEFSDILWPRSSVTGAGGQDGIASGQGGILQSVNQYWEWNTALSGNHSPKKITGQVLDSNSNPVSGATVQVFNTATGLLVSTTTSNSDGTYQGSDPNAVNSFAVGYEAGSPDIAGTTVNTVTGT